MATKSLSTTDVASCDSCANILNMCNNHSNGARDVHAIQPNLANYTNHARKRMDERYVSDSNVQEILERGAVKPQYRGDTEYKLVGKVRVPRVGWSELTIVVGISKVRNTYMNFIETVYWSGSNQKEVLKTLAEMNN